MTTLNKQTIYIPVDGGVSKVHVVDNAGNVKKVLDWCPNLGYRLQENEGMKAATDNITFLLINLKLDSVYTESIESESQELNHP
jgi:hypothetical protein